MAKTISDRNRKVCLLTGAGGVLGGSFCRACAADYQIVAVYRRRPPPVSSQTQRFLDPLSPGAALPENANLVFSIQADLTQAGQIERIVELALTRFGHIDLLVNAAVYSCWGPMLDSPRLLESVDRQFAMNVRVPLELAAVVAREFWRGRKRENVTHNRNVINLSSTAGVWIYPNSEQSVYSASKAALNYASCHMAKEFAALGVRVNALAPNAFPGIVPTERVVRAIQTLDQGAETGQILIVDSGREQFYRPKANGSARRQNQAIKQI